MAILDLSLSNFPDLINKFSSYEDGYYPISLEDIKRSEISEDLIKILDALSDSLNEENIFSCQIIHGLPAAIYGFSLIRKDSKACLIFGSLNFDINEIPIKVSKLPEEDLIIFKAGKALLNLDLKEAFPRFYLQVGRISVPVYSKWVPTATSIEVENIDSEEDLVNLLQPRSIQSCKLTDIVRPYVRKGCLGALPEKLDIPIDSWEFQAPHPEYGSSLLLRLKSNYQLIAEKDSGEIIKNPSGIYINHSHNAFKFLQNPKFAQQAILYKYAQGDLILSIIALNSKNPEKFAPVHLLRLQPPKEAGNQKILNHFLDLLNKGIPSDRIISEYKEKISYESLGYSFKDSKALPDADQEPEFPLF